MVPSPNVLPSLSAEEQKKALDELFEPCPQFTTYIIPKVFASDVKLPDYDSYTALIEAVRKNLLELNAEQKKNPTADRKQLIDGIVAAHPRLGVPKTTKLSDHSASEQKSLSGDPELAEKLAKLNKEYEDTFPGLRYVVFVNGRSRDVIMANMRERISRNDFDQEVDDAFNAMCDIAIDRASKSSDSKL